MDEIINFKKSYMLFMPNIKLKDFISTEDRYTNKLIEKEFEHTNIKKIFYKKNPKYFTSLSKWPSNTNCKCWECSCDFVGPPIFIPLKITKKNNGNILMETYGNFCWFNCAQKWINEKYKYDNSFSDKTELLKILYTLFTKKHINKIIEAQDKTIMMQYCGEGGISVEEYKKQNGGLNDFEI